MLADVLRALRCPVCGEPMAEEGRALACRNRHAFDVARQGYVNLLSGGAHTGTADTPGMVAARERFLSRGYYAPIAGAVAEILRRRLSEGLGGPLAESGAGTGYYLAAALDALPDRSGVALDISKHAARKAAGVHPRLVALVCDAWGRLPLRDASVAAMLDVFAPRNAEEFARVIAAGGLLVVVTPTPRHLRELVAPLGMLSVEERKPERVEAALGGAFERVAGEPLEYVADLHRIDVEDLAAMGPSARHAAPGEFARRAAELPDPARVTVSVDVAAYERR